MVKDANETLVPHKEEDHVDVIGLTQEVRNQYHRAVDRAFKKKLPEKLHEPENFEESEWELHRIIPIHEDEVLEKTVLVDPEGNDHTLGVLTLAK